MRWTLETPMMEVEFRDRPTWKEAIAVYAVGLVLTVVFLAAYAVYLPQYVGFETALLVGLGLTAMGVFR